MWRGRVEFPELKRVLIAQAEQWKPNAILVEDRASGQSLIQELKSTTLPILPIKVDSDKLSRAQAVTAFLEFGKVYVPEEAPWLAAEFPPPGMNDARTPVRSRKRFNACVVLSTASS